MAARVTEVCDALVAALVELWPAGATAPNAVERAYLTPVDLGALAGRRVWVTPAGFEDGQADRRANLGQYTVALVVAERYAGDEARPPRAWLDERVEFLELVYDLVSSYGNRRASGWLAVGDPARRHFTERAAVGEVYSFEYLDRQHVFWAELEIELREVR